MEFVNFYEGDTFSGQRRNEMPGIYYTQIEIQTPNPRMVELLMKFVLKEILFVQ